MLMPLALSILAMCTSCDRVATGPTRLKQLQEAAPLFYWHYSPGTGVSGELANAGLRFALWEDGSALIRTTNSFDFRFGRLESADVAQVRSLAEMVSSTNRRDVIRIDGSSAEIRARLGTNWFMWGLAAGHDTPARLADRELSKRLAIFEVFKLEGETRIRWQDIPRFPGEFWVNPSWENGGWETELVKQKDRITR